MNGNIVGDTDAQMKLGTLANNGGPTQTIAPLAGSPATDQRDGSYVRVVGTVDIGAYEVQAASPQVSTNPSSTTVNAGQTATFTAAASANPAATVQWQVSTNGGGTFVNIAGATSTTLSFTTNVSQNGNQYHAVFTNSVGSATTTAATLTVSAAAGLGSLNPPTATVNAPYSGSIPITGGVGPFSKLTATGLPAGVSASIDPSGTAIDLIGQPTQLGDYKNIQLSVTDSSGAVASGTFDLLVGEAHSLVVTTTSDTVNATDGVTSVREAIAYADSLGTGTHIVTFDPTVFPDGSLTTITLGGTALTVGDATGTVAIQGLAANRIAISGNNASSVFVIDDDTTISGLTITGGAAHDGAGINLTTSSGPTIHLTVDSCNITANAATFYGGGIFERVTSADTAVVTAENSAIFGNTGGGIGVFVDNAAAHAATLTVINSTITNNSTGGDYNIVGKTPTTYGGGNTTLAGTHNQIGVDPLLGTPGYYGGTTETIPLLSGSPAIGAGESLADVTTDQRGLPRKSTPDIGAY